MNLCNTSKARSLVAILVLAATCVTASEDFHSVIGSRHDLTANPAVKGPETACAFCHSIEEGTGEISKELNRSDPGSSPTMYDNSRLKTKSDKLAPVSSHCMSCHDGQTPFDAINGSAGTENNDMNTLYSNSTAIIGTDLTIHHPVGVSNPVDAYFISPSGIESSGLALPGGKVECITCHDVHSSTGIDGFLTMEKSSSSLCLACHNK